ncbi:RsmB/NOP family class I SAM-dependent RNA methyltransferase [Sphingomonas sp. AX6]|uniref:RsmB/NOP family class I SAM-dependent RNA methyltransferase n=1 Tax=Sphingomonas sp. AX6 TaxID=2653171 RepID=UPI0012F159EB|nr:RsmB/NOP family class I SAM-dependent RNA methyltransferase [Sphingomonas sp. AX6]VXC97073.1 RNA methyltransferase [Sphingomonas sp. AX6]
MIPAARTQAAIELLDAIITSARDGGAAADTLIARYFADRRYAGSKDRRAVRGLVYDAIRLLGERPENGRAAMLALAETKPELTVHFGGEGHAPSAIEPDEPRARTGLVPKWLGRMLTAGGIDRVQQAALLDRAPLDIRVNTLRGDVATVREAFPEAEPIAGLPNGLRLPPDSSIERHELFESGAIEVQDAGSQFVSLASAAAPGMTVIDLCAGGGGKTLALAAMMENRGRIVASDIDRGRLSRLPARAERAGVTIAEPLLLDGGREAHALERFTASADLVLIDAPCSGTGTWRRNPEARWRLNPDRLARLTATQSSLLDLGSRCVKSGGALVHIVCSLLDAEGCDQVAAFVTRNPGWTVVEIDGAIGAPHGLGRRLTPATHSTDGFFVAMMRAP